MEKSTIKFYPQDIFLKKTILRLIPKTIKPNHITLLRFFLTPIVIGAIIKEKNILALFLFLITAFTDAIDGAMARTRNQITQWGKIYDPLADKFLIGLTAFF